MVETSSWPKNVIVAQSGGPTAVINNTLRGILDTCQAMPDRFGTVYAGYHGIEGVLKEELLDLSAQPAEEIAAAGARRPPRAASAPAATSSRAHRTEDFARVIEVFRAHDIGYFFYIGGNDSMDTANKVAKLAHRSADWTSSRSAGPRRIDNDVGDSEFKLIDHTPGYGSVARYWALNVQGANEENAGSSPADPVLVIQAMGRKIGFIPAAARLADPRPRDAAADLSGRIRADAGGDGRTSSTTNSSAAGDASSSSARVSTSASVGEAQRQLRPYHVLVVRDDGRAASSSIT